VACSACLLCSGVGAPRPISFSTLGRGGRGSLCFRLFAGGFTCSRLLPCAARAGGIRGIFFIGFPGFSTFFPRAFLSLPAPAVRISGLRGVTVSVHAVVPSWPVHAFSLLETILYQGFFARFCRLCKLIKTVCIIDFLFPDQCVQWQSVHIFSRRRVWV
jgi:hypothetical protein